MIGRRADDPTGRPDGFVTLACVRPRCIEMLDDLRTYDGVERRFALRRKQAFRAGKIHESARRMVATRGLDSADTQFDPNDVASTDQQFTRSEPIPQTASSTHGRRLEALLSACCRNLRIADRIRESTRHGPAKR